MTWLKRSVVKHNPSISEICYNQHIKHLVSCFPEGCQYLPSVIKRHLHNHFLSPCFQWYTKRNCCIDNGCLSLIRRTPLESLDKQTKWLTYSDCLTYLFYLEPAEIFFFNANRKHQLNMCTLHVLPLFQMLVKSEQMSSMKAMAWLLDRPRGFRLTYSIRSVALAWNRINSSNVERQFSFLSYSQPWAGTSGKVR